MDLKEASWRILGTDDFIKLFIKTLENTKAMKRDDRMKLFGMLNDIRLVMIMRYQKEIKNAKESGIG